MKKALIYDLLKLSITNRLDDCNSFAYFDEEDWKYAFSILSMHGVAPLACEGINRLPAELRPPKDVLLKFVSVRMSVNQSYLKLTDLVDKIGELITKSEVKCLLLKGLSLADYYPSPELRKFVDIDLYAPGAAVRLDNAFVEKGVKVDTDFYRHSHMKLSGVLVENHHCLLDLRGRREMAVLDDDLKEMAISHLSSFKEPGLYYPNALFSLIFNLHHAMSHFIYEGISLKFLVDWIFFLRKGIEHLTTDQISASLQKHGLLKFAAVMSEVSVKHLGLNMDEVPECIRQEMVNLKSSVVDRFIDDLFRPYEKVHQRNLFVERLHNVRRIVRAAWKPKEFLGQSAIGFVWDKFVPILLGQKFEAD